MSPVHLRNLGFQRNQPEDREGLFRTRRPGRGNLGHSGEWQDNEGNHTHSAIHFPIQQEPQTRGLDKHESSSSDPPTPQRFISMEHGQQEVQPGIPLGRTWSKLPEALSQRDRLQRPYDNDQRPNQLSNGFTPFRSQQISGQEPPFFTIPASFQEKARIQGQKQDHFQPEKESVRPNDPEALGFGEGSTQQPEVVVNNSRISSPLNRNITPTQIENNALSSENNLNSDALWLQMSQCAEKTQKQFAELEESHERMKKLTASMDKMFKTLQEGHAQLRKASEETHKRLNIGFEAQHHSRRDRDCLDQDINRLFNVYHNLKPNHKAKSPSQYQDGDGMSYSENKALKQLPEASSWPKFSGTGEYNHMELIDYIDGLFIDVPSIPDYWMTARLNTVFKGHASIWYKEMKEIHGRRNWPSWKSKIIQKYSNGTWIWQKTMSFDNDKYSVDKDPYEWCLRQSKILKDIVPQMNIQMRNHKPLTQLPGELEHAVKFRCNQNCTLDDIANNLQHITKRTNIGKLIPYKSSGFREKQHLRVEFKDKPKERVAEVAKKNNYCHNCGATDHYANNCPKAKKKVYSIEKVLEEESPTEDSDPDSMGDAIIEPSDDDQDPREEL
ncbi:hypothetical protein O181_012958 [Austropuccinia psidii MF-1]|uniref:CCHC-type domain-containing protein n=1 Tax=Austropuccinia psidii MF-1 TaxID=1389203 RepID=A0A9Q3GMN8_9BASI|nr:hypothetical protein [Austropuccinia psidii MF-1]